jgi:seryl-tRNA synthetase
MLDITLLRKDLTPSVEAALETRKTPRLSWMWPLSPRWSPNARPSRHAPKSCRPSATALSKQIGQLKAKGESADAVMAQVNALKGELDSSAVRLEQMQAELQALLLAVPNLPHASVPVGADEQWQRQGARMGQAAKL